jgi:WD40 repeat protein
VLSLLVGPVVPGEPNRIKKQQVAKRAETVCIDRNGDPLPAGAVGRLGTTRWRHVDDRGISWVRFSADGGTVLSVGSEGSVRCWETATGRERWHFGVEGGDGDQVVITPDGRVVVSWTGHVIRVWDPAAGKLLRELQVEGEEVSHVQVGPDGQMLATVVKGGEEKSWVELWNLRTGKKVRTIVPALPKGKQKGFHFGRLFFAAGGKVLAVPGQYGEEDTAYRFWDVGTATELAGLTPYPHIDEFPPLSPNGKLLVALAKGRPKSTVVRLLDAATGKELRRLRPPLTEEVVGTRFSPDCRTVAVVEGLGQVRLWDVSTGKALPLPTEKSYRVWSLVFAPDSQMVAVEDSETVRLFQVATGKLVHELKTASPEDEFPRQTGGPTPTFPVALNPGVAFSPDGKLVAARANYNLIRRWKVATGEELAPGPAGHEQRVCAVGVTPDGRTAGSVSGDGTLRLWDLAKSRVRQVLPLPWGEDYDGRRPRYSGRYCVAFTPDSLTVAATSPFNMVRLWDVATGKKRLQFEVVDGGVHSLVFAPDGNQFFTGGTNGVVCWDAHSGKRIRQMAKPEQPDPGPGIIDNRSPPALTVSPDGRLLAAAGTRQYSPDNGALVWMELRFWELATGQLRHCYPNPDHRKKKSRQRPQFDDRDPSRRRGPNVAAFAPDGKTLACNSNEAIELWDVFRGRRVRQFGGPVDSVCGIAWCPGNRVLAIAHDHGVIRLVDSTDGSIRGTIHSPQGGITSLAFNPDGRTLLTGGKDTTILVWDLNQILATKALRPQPLSQEELTKLWNELASSEGNLAGKAIMRLEDRPVEAVALLRNRLQRAVPVQAKRLEILFADFSNPRYAVRKKAEAEFARLGERAEPFLSKRLKESPPLDVRQRLERLLENLGGFVTVSERMRELRAVEVLEHIGTAEARRVLRELAGGAPEARLTKEAKAALVRLDRERASD